MSAKPRSGGFTPTISEDAVFTISQFKDVLSIYDSIYQRLTKSPEVKLAKWSIYAAGVAAVIEILHIAWLATRYIWKF